MWKKSGAKTHNFEGLQRLPKERGRGSHALGMSEAIPMQKGVLACCNGMVLRSHLLLRRQRNARRAGFSCSHETKLCALPRTSFARLVDTGSYRNDLYELCLLSPVSDNATFPLVS